MYNIHALQVLEELNRRKEGPRLDLVLFDAALEHLVRLHRVLRIFRGHAVLIGGPGMGRKSLMRLTMLAAHCSPVYLPHANTTPYVLRKSLKSLFVKMGMYKKTIALLITDADLEREGSLIMKKLLDSVKFII
jgi:dynein heavy chain